MSPVETRDEGEIYIFRLYVTASSQRSVTAYNNLKRICEEYLQDKYRIEIIDLAKNAYLAKRDQIVALPTLIKWSPLPMKRIIGDLSDTEKVLKGLEIGKFEVHML